MPFSLDSWKAQMRQRLQGWRPRMQRTGINSVYAAISAATLWPVVAAARNGEWAALAALGAVVAGVGANLLANQLQDWKDEEDAAQQLAESVPQQPDLRAELDAVLEKLDALPAASEALPENDRAWFGQTLREELSRLGSAIKYDAVLLGDGTLALGEGATALGRGSTQVKGDVKGDLIVEGDNKRVIRAGIFVEKQEIHVAPTREQADPEQIARDRADHARRRYLERLRRLCHTLPLAALGGSESDDQDLTLERVYIELDTTTQIASSDEDKKRRRPEILAGRGEDSRPMSALEAASQSQRLVLLGDPGAGKSTFVHMLLGWQAAAVLGETQVAPPGCSTDLLPILVTLRDLAPRLECLELPAMSDQRQKEALVAAVRAQIMDDLSRLEADDFAGGLGEALSEGHCLLALDGLDEVPQAQRGCIRQAVAAVIGMYKPARIILTCRVRSYLGDAEQPNFQAHTLAPFAEEKIRSFVQGWYNAQKELGHVDAEQARQRAKNLADAAAGPDLPRACLQPHDADCNGDHPPRGHRPAQATRVPL